MYPISEQISQKLLATLAGVTVVAGYETTLIAQRASRPSPTPQKLLAILYEGEDQEDGNGDGESGGAPMGFVGWKRPYAVLIWAAGSETDTTPYDTLLNCARADVEKAVTQDQSVCGLARNVVIKQPLKIENDNEPPAVIVNFDVTYWTRFNDPYAQS